MELHEKLYKLRKSKGLTQAELAEQLDVSRQSVSNWELGTVIPSTKRLRDLSQLYNVPLDYLLDESRAENQDKSPMEEGTSSIAKDNYKITEPISKSPQKKDRAIRIIAITIAAVILLTLTILVLIHNSKGEEEGSKGTLLNEWSKGEIGSEIEGEFDLS